MKLLKIFKKKTKKKEEKKGKKERKQKEEKIKKEKKEKKENVPKPKKESPKKPLVKQKPQTERPLSQSVGVPEKKKRAGKGGLIAPRILVSPHIAEKPTELIDINQYVLRVFPRANKTEIKKAIEEVYNVDVIKVRTIKVPAKRRKVGKTQGWRKGYKKAVITVKKGQEIEILPR